MNSEARRGVAFGFAAYFLWGAFPLYFRLLDASGAVEILLHRILWSLAVLLVVVAAVRVARADLRAVLRRPRLVAGLGAAALLIAVNWGIYIYAVNSGQVVEAALGYFINPLVTVALGVVVLRERLRPAQWAAVAVGAVAVAVLTIDYGRLPWLALTLAASFGTYGLIKNRVGGSVGALSGLTTETLLLAPITLGLLVWLELSGRGTFTENAPWQALLLVSSGLVTVGPLLFFAAAARRVPLTTMGLLQYLTPMLQLLCGVLLLGEHVPPARWAGFGLVWLALVILTADTLRAARRTARRSPAPEPELVAAAR
jgi:chloramphenicol-sensitive protein RarD